MIVSNPIFEEGEPELCEFADCKKSKWKRNCPESCAEIGIDICDVWSSPLFLFNYGMIFVCIVL